jgi:PAS domain-containing protein
MANRRLENIPANELGAVLPMRNGILQGIISFMAAAPMPGFLKDARGRVLYLNRDAEELFERDLKTVRGMTIPEMLNIMPGEARRTITTQDRRILNSSSPLVFVDHALPQVGATRLATLKFRVLLDNDDKVIAGLIVKLS